jgi:hypothetical protein
LIRGERATRKNSQLAAAQKVALKMGGRVRCSSVTSRPSFFAERWRGEMAEGKLERDAPSYRQSDWDRLAGGPF